MQFKPVMHVNVGIHERKSYNHMPHLFTLFRCEISIAQQRTFPGVVQLMKLKLNC